MNKLIRLLSALMLLILPIQGEGTVKIQEEDANPKGTADIVKIPNGSLTLSGNTATLSYLTGGVVWGGDLTGTGSNPMVVQWYGQPLDSGFASPGTNKIPKYDGSKWSLADDETGTSGSGGMSIVKENDSVVVNPADKIDFGSGFDVNETPTAEANITMDLSEAVTGDVVFTNNVSRVDKVESVDVSSTAPASGEVLTATGTNTADWDLSAGHPGDWGCDNCQITTTVASNVLTVALKSLSGNTPDSGADKITIRIGNNLRTVTSALSVVITAGTNWFNAGAAETATQDTDYFSYLIWNTTDTAVSLGVSRIPYGRVYSDFSTTTTSCNYMFYSGSAPAATDQMSAIGRYNAALSATASFNWSIPATSIIINHPIDRTRWLTFVPTITVSGGTAPTYTSVFINQYYIHARELAIQTIWVNTSGGTAGAGVGAINWSVPFDFHADFTSVRAVLGGGQHVGSAHNGEIYTLPTNIVAGSNRIFMSLYETTQITGGDQSSTSRYIATHSRYKI